MANGFSRDTLTAVGNLQNYVTVFTAGANVNIAVWPIVVDGIGEKIGDELVESVGVTASFSAAKIASNAYVPLFGKRADAVDADTRVFR